MRFTLPLLLLAGTVPAQSVDFAKDVWPILKSRCVRCHRAAHEVRGRLRKPKGGLRLDSKPGILRGSKHGEVLVAGKPDDSRLYQLPSLPRDDDDRMPPRGKGLTADQLSMLHKWIESGAEFGGWVGAPDDGPTTPVKRGESGEEEDELEPAAVHELEHLADGVAAADAAAVKRAAGDLARIVPALPGSPLLRVEYPSAQDHVGDSQVAALAPIAANVSHLDLGRSKVTDKALATVAKMPRLVHLDLHRTAITDHGLTALGALHELRYLNLYGTGVTDQAVEALAAIKSLRAIYLWGSHVSEDGAAHLRHALPHARVVRERRLPSHEREGEEHEREGEEHEGRRRRRRF